MDALATGLRYPYLAQLSPIKHVPTIKFKDELVVDFRLGEGSCVDHKQAYKHKHQEKATVHL